MEFKKFNAINVSSKFAICGLPIRVDTYKTCYFGCTYCFSNNRKIMGFEKNLQIGNIKSIEKKLSKIFDKKQVDNGNLLDNLIAQNITWHCGGMSDPFQPIEAKLHVTRDMIDVTNKYNVSILFSTKSDNTYDCNIRPDLHSFHLSVTNLNDRKDIEPNIPNIENRVKFYKDLKAQGFKVGIRVQPFIPNITTDEIIDVFHDADYFTIEGLKLVPQNKEHKDYLLNLLDLNKEAFTQMGLLNLKPEIRQELYKTFIEKLNKYSIPFSIADNDMHHISSGKCCCGDPLIKKSTDFNNTALIHKFGINYTLDNVKGCLSCVGECKANHLFTSNRQEGCVSVLEFYEKRFDRPSSPFSPKFLYKLDN
jgi:DNA repair photolyase